MTGGRLPRANILANLAGNGWASLVQLLFVPVYLRVLGPESFALIGVWTTLQAVTNLLDLGLSTTVNREMARRSTGDDASPVMRDLLRTLEAVYWPLGLVIAVAVFAAAPWLAGSWLNASRMPAEELTLALRMIGLVLALQWPYDLYAGALLGLQRQVELNVVLAVVATLRAVGGALVLWFVAPTAVAFFAWQAVCSVVQTALPLALVWRGLATHGRAPRFSGTLLREVSGFAAGVLGISSLTAVLAHVDKAIVSRALPLQDFGYYALAGMVASALGRLAGPIFTALYPRLSQLVARDDPRAEASLYHASSRLVAAVVVPPALVLTAFAPSVLLVWTGDAAIAAKVAPILSLLVLGTALNGVMHMPYALQLAHGWTSLSLRINLAAVIIVPPGIVVAVRLWGAPGAAAVWAGLNACYLIFGVYWMHRRLLRGQLRDWFLNDLARPTLAAGMVVGASWLLLPAGLGRVPLGIFLALAGVAGLSAALASITDVRRLLDGSFIRSLGA